MFYVALTYGGEIVASIKQIAHSKESINFYVYACLAVKLFLSYLPT